MFNLLQIGVLCNHCQCYMQPIRDAVSVSSFPKGTTHTHAIHNYQLSSFLTP